MNHDTQLNEDELLQLKKFHESHFIGQNVPAVEHSNVTNHASESSGQVSDEGDLGYYADGVKRNLTDDQIAMFRNSEIQKIIQEKRRAAEREEMCKQEGDRPDQRADQGGGQKTWTKHFDEAEQRVDTLMYDDNESAEATQHEPGPGSQQFLWPKLS